LPHGGERERTGAGRLKRRDIRLWKKECRVWRLDC
jgi:hypothetical protein